MNDGIELNVPSTVDTAAIVSWLSEIVKLSETEDLALEVVTDAYKTDGERLLKNDDWVSIKIHVGPCPGRHKPWVRFKSETPDPPPEMRTIELRVRSEG